MNSIEKGLINLCKWSIGKLNKINLKNILQNLTVAKEQLKINSNVDVEKQTLEIYNCH